MQDDLKSEAARPLYVGFDLGTTNSAVAVFDGVRVNSARTRHGGFLTPSVVRISKKGTISVGAKARRFLESDPANTRSEFKRLMGTDTALTFEASETSKRPFELSAEILKALRADVHAQFGINPAAAVITVPALFELPQSSDTTRAAQSAGLEKIELLQEPVASALAAGWSDDEPGKWLVYDLGGGTFDVSLLETRDGLLRVVGHDGDNFLGGRDFDRAIVDWMVEQLNASEEVTLERGKPDHAPAFRQLMLAAEEAKIDLSSNGRASISLASPVMVDDEEIDIDLEIDRQTFESLVLPLVDRSIAVCHRLLAEQGLQREQISKVVLVGGPTSIPLLLNKVRDEIAPIADGDLDPMTLVSTGAAIYAASMGLNAVPKAESAVALPKNSTALWMHYPPVSADLEPNIVGRVIDSQSATPETIVFERNDGHFKSEAVSPDEEGAFVASLKLKPRQSNSFKILATDKNGTPVSVAPESITIIQGLNIGDPPLSRSVGVALANGYVRIYMERGTPLPAKRSFVHRTVEPVLPGSDAVLSIPIVQGEYDQARLCRKVGELKVPATDLKSVLPSNTAIEVTVELDRSGHMVARAMISSTEQVFEGVAQLLVPLSSPEVLDTEIARLSAWLSNTKMAARREGDVDTLARLEELRENLAQADSDLGLLFGGDEDAGQRARRALLDIEAALVEIDAHKAWPELVTELEDEINAALSWVGELGSEAERTQLERSITAAQDAIDRKSLGEAQRRLRMIRNQTTTAYLRSPGAWVHEFEYAASRMSETQDLGQAQKLVDQGRQKLSRNETAGLDRIVRKLWDLLPPTVKEQAETHGSGVR